MHPIAARRLEGGMDDESRMEGIGKDVRDKKDGVFKDQEGRSTMARPSHKNREVKINASTIVTFC